MLPKLVYVETTFGLSYATGRNLQALALLERRNVAIAIPEFCLSEATRTFYSEIDTYRKQYAKLATIRVSEAERIDTNSARNFIEHQAKASAFEATERNESERRFREIAARLTRQARLVRNRAAWYEEQPVHFSNPKDLYDDAILDAVLHDAATVERSSYDTLIFFTENSKSSNDNRRSLERSRMQALS